MKKTLTPVATALKTALADFNELMIFADESPDLGNKVIFLWLAIGEWNKIEKLVRKVGKLERMISKS